MEKNSSKMIFRFFQGEKRAIGNSSLFFALVCVKWILLDWRSNFTEYIIAMLAKNSVNFFLTNKERKRERQSRKIVDKERKKKK